MISQTAAHNAANSVYNEIAGAGPSTAHEKLRAVKALVNALDLGEPEPVLEERQDKTTPNRMDTSLSTRSGA